jgi:cell division protein FtsA
MKQAQHFGIDVGTTKVVAISGRVEPRRRIAEVMALGEAYSRGLRRGIVMDRRAAGESIAEAIENSGERPRSASVGIAGGHISSFNTEVTLLNRGRNKVITPRFLKRLENEVEHTPLDPDEQVIHIIPRSYTLDGEEGVRQPLGLAARRVTLQAHVISGSVQSIQNLLWAVEDCGVRVSEVVLEPLASSESCLTEQERDMGVVLLDIGGGTTDLATFWRGSLTHTAVIPLGGQSFSSDAAFGFKVPVETAERLKIRYGTVLSGTVDTVAAVRLGDRHYNAHFLSQILEYRAQEILEMARDSLDRARVRHFLTGGAVLTGGGSLLDGMPELAEDMLEMRTRVAAPRRVRGEIKPLQEPQYSTAVGLLYFAAKSSNLKAQNKGASASAFGSIVAAVKSWFGGGKPKMGLETRQ